MIDPDRIDVKDASTNEDLERIIKETTGKVFAGAAAWAGKLVDAWLSASRKAPSMILSPEYVFIVSGSLNPLSLEQVKFWEENGRASIDINEDKKNVTDEGDLMIKTSIEKTDGSLKKLSKLANHLWDKGNWNRLILNGGDTAYEFMVSAGIGQVNVIKSLLPGIAVTGYMDKYIVLKPGGYGDPETLLKLARLLGGK